MEGNTDVSALLMLLVPGPVSHLTWGMSPRGRLCPGTGTHRPLSGTPECE